MKAIQITKPFEINVIEKEKPMNAQANFEPNAKADFEPQSLKLDFQPSTLPNQLMTCRFCLRHAWGQCLKERHDGNEKWQEPLYLVLGDGRRFRLGFDCKKCEMTVLKP